MGTEGHGDWAETLLCHLPHMSLQTLVTVGCLLHRSLLLNDNYTNQPAISVSQRYKITNHLLVITQRKALKNAAFRVTLCKFELHSAGFFKLLPLGIVGKEVNLMSLCIMLEKRVCMCALSLTCVNQWTEVF